METTVPKQNQSNSAAAGLYMAFELGEKKWKLAFTVGLGQRPRMRTIGGSDQKAVLQEILRARRRFALSEQAPVLSCYEAGREGFWLHRFLLEQGIRNWVVDSSSIEVNRKRRRVKSDRLDAGKLVQMLLRYDGGDKRVWKTLRVPSPEHEDDRHLHRSLKRFKQERTRLGNRIRGLLKTQGITPSGSLGSWQESDLDGYRDWQGEALREGLKQRLGRELRALQRVRQEIQQMEIDRRQLLHHAPGAKWDQIRQLESLKGIGINAAWTLVMEVFGWRQLKNRRQVGAALGLTPSAYQSGSSYREQGISKEGNRWCRDVIVEVAWMWLHWQPESELTQWFQHRFAAAGKRARKVGIVALSRKLSIQLWRFLQWGEIPPGAVFHSSR
jgi:transposase